jgi:hypothetical protein
MQKRKRSSPASPRTYSEQQLVGLHTHAQAQKQNTVERLTAAIVSLNQQKKPISAKTIYEECGLEHAALRRNPEALQLFQRHSTFLKRERKQKQKTLPDAPSRRDSMPTSQKSQPADRGLKEKQRCEELEAQNAMLLEVMVQKDITIAELQARLVAHEKYLGEHHAHLQRQEYQEKDR